MQYQQQRCGSINSGSGGTFKTALLKQMFL